MKRKFLELIDRKLITHFRDSHVPTHDLCLGTVIGLFWALTPLIGFQMSLVSITWVFLRFFKIHFNLPVALALVWITNPFTMPFFYYTFYLSGYHLFHLLGMNSEPISFRTFSGVLNKASVMGFTEGFLHWGNYMIFRLGWPMLAGSFFIGVPLSIISYPFTQRFLIKHRTKLAKKMGLTLEEWEDIYVYKKRKPPRIRVK